MEITLRQVTEKDIDFLFILRQEYGQVDPNAVPSYSDHKEFVKNHTYKKWFIILEDEIKVGAVAIKKNGEFGYQLQKDSQGKGIMNAVFKIILRNHPEVWARSKPHNFRSHKLLEKFGFKITDYEYHRG